MKGKRKAIIVFVCTAVLLIGSLLGTMAYLTDSQSAKNTFTVGQVHIKLDEAVVDAETGKAVVPAARTEEGKGNTDVKLIPGRVVDKDPTVTVVGGSEECYVRMLLTVSYAEAADAVLAGANYDDWFNFDSNWTAQENVKTTKADGIITRTYEFRYKGTVAQADADTKLDPLFTTITVPGALTNDQIATLDKLSIDVVAQAIQAEGFGTADEAWDNFPNN